MIYTYVIPIQALQLFDFSEQAEEPQYGFHGNDREITYESDVETLFENLNMRKTKVLRKVQCIRELFKRHNCFCMLQELTEATVFLSGKPSVSIETKGGNAR